MQPECQSHYLTFYQDLPSFTKFSDFISTNHFSPAPDNWLIIISDVVDSSTVMTNGQYKEVNMVGVSCITSVHNALLTNKICDKLTKIIHQLPYTCHITPMANYITT
ncbi:DUF3095 family protein [Spartinivicinus ruber]|uniref:DUF3095 family protein n=1 Tax=Spartinivicinus ruber TaxID=2683272 RepID=UPI0013D0934F